MKETVAAYQSRSGHAYDPASWLSAIARPIADGDACPTLFRYPGPCGLQEALGGSMMWLAKPDQPLLWLSDAPLHHDGPGAQHFGTLALLEPLRFSPALTRETIARPDGSVATVYVAANQPIPDPEAALWVPPSRLSDALPWDALRTPKEVKALFGSGYDDERMRVQDAVGAYLEELSAMEKTGAPAPGGPWCAVPADERRRLLADAGLTGRWTS